MPCKQVAPMGDKRPPFRTGYATEAECNQACKEGACCEGTTCSVKPQCQCQGTGKVFKGVGTVCTPNPCGRCGCTTGIVNATTITLSISGASLLFSPQDPDAVGYEQMRNGGLCANDAAVISWLNGITVTLLNATDPVTGVQSWKGQATTQSHVSSVLVQCELMIGCNGAAALTVKYCPDGSNTQTCMRQYGDNDIWRFNVGNPCTATSASVAGFFGQAVATFSGGGCRLGPGGFVAIRGFTVPYAITANPLP